MKKIIGYSLLSIEETKLREGEALPEFPIKMTITEEQLENAVLLPTRRKNIFFAITPDEEVFFIMKKETPNDDA